jgi:2-C-methyl-D-erythritol 4-phosphate cytidylyltransferase
VATTDSRSTSAVLVAAGRSARMGAGSERKPFLLLEGRTVLEHACAAFDEAPNVVEIVLVACEEDLERARRLVAASPAARKVRAVVAGGELRPDSVAAGVAAARTDVALLAIHDAARPLVEPDLVERAIAVAATRGAALVAVPVTDTIKTSSDGKSAESTLDRSVLWRAQTPQVFRAELFRSLLERAAAEGYRPTDDAALHETYVGPVAIVPGDARNLKITESEDLRLATAILRDRAASRSSSSSRGKGPS